MAREHQLGTKQVLGIAYINDRFHPGAFCRVVGLHCHPVNSRTGKRNRGAEGQRTQVQIIDFLDSIDPNLHFAGFVGSFCDCGNRKRRRDMAAVVRRGDLDDLCIWAAEGVGELDGVLIVGVGFITGNSGWEVTRAVRD